MTPEQNRRLKAKERRTAYFQTHGPCSKCQSWESLELDHIIPTGLKKNTASQKLWRWSELRRIAELAKCQILCRKCHRSKTSLEQRRYNHGRSLYERHGCRCQICRDAQSLRKRIYRNSQKKNPKKIENNFQETDSFAWGNPTTPSCVSG